MNTDYVPDTITGAGDTAVSKTDINVPPFIKLTFQWSETGNETHR